ncbi:MAG: tetratricopeptide repeat protein [Streptosporangiaceae bacterium]|nr:tetratricopeptide repeat protein [Streptosporangiaceae bacterium]MBV9853202.1 tetratricopeptide repeat protein [Streptosporangiaceae bacterium]
MTLACVLSAAVAAVLNKVGVRDWRPQAVAVALAAAATLSGTIWREWLINALKGSADFDNELARGTFMPGGRLPRIKEISNPILIGVHPAPLRDTGNTPDDGRVEDRVPLYVKRDIDAELRRALAGSCFVVLVGDSTAGKTRTAFEAMREVLPEHLFIGPSERDAVGAALERAATERKCVVWLDDLQRYLGSGGLTRKALAELLSGTGHHRVVLATLRAIEESRLTAPMGENSQESAYIGQTVLDQATRRIMIDRLFSVAEQGQARRIAREDPRLADAIEHASSYGIGEYLACGPQLLTEWEDAWARGYHPRGAALIAAAVDCRRAGFADPLPRPLLDELHEVYLARRGGSQLHPEGLDDAWNWVTMPRDSGNTPLWAVRDGYFEVFDYLIDVIQRHSGESVPDETVRAALCYAEAADASNIAVTAWHQGRYPLAEIAIRQAYAAFSRAFGSTAAETLASRNNLAVVLHAEGRLGDAEAEYRAVVQARAVALGSEHPDTLVSRNNLAAVLHAEGRLGDAEAEYRAVVQARAVALGSEHPDTLVSRNNLAVFLTDLGRLDDAEAEHRSVLDARARLLGEDHPHTVISRDNLASVLRRRSAGGEVWP